MLRCELDRPSEQVGRYVLRFLESAPWIRRRIETISFLDVDTVIRRTTIDIGMSEVADAAAFPTGIPKILTGRRHPMYTGRPLVPLTMLDKNLLEEFDLRDASGVALPVVPREVDAFLAWSALCVAASDQVGIAIHDLRPKIVKHLHEIAFAFPTDRQTSMTVDPAAWSTTDWRRRDKSAWQRLLDSSAFERLLRDFTFGFLLVTQLDSDKHLQLVKFSYRQTVPQKIRLVEALGLAAIELPVEVPELGNCRGYHLRVESPPGMVLTDAALFRVFDETNFEVPDDLESAPLRGYQKRIGPEGAQIYGTSSLRSGVPQRAAVALRVPILGFLRAAWLASILTLGVLLAGRLFMNDIERALSSRADAGVAIALIGPTLLAAYLVRPDEHAITSRLVRPLRYALAVSALLSYMGAGSLVIADGSDNLETFWNWLLVGSSIVAAYLSTVVAATQLDLRTASKLPVDTQPDSVADVIEF